MSHRTRHVICLRHPNLPKVYFNLSDAFKTIANLPARLPGPDNELIFAVVSYSMDGSIVTSHQTGIAYNLLADSVTDGLGGFRLLMVLPTGRTQEGNSYHELKRKYSENNKNSARAGNKMITIIMQYEIRMGKVSFSPVEQQLPPSPVPPPPVTPQPNRQSPSRTANDNDERKWFNQAVGGLLQVCDKQQDEISGLTETCSKQKETTTMLVGCVKHLNENIQEVDKKQDRERAKTNAKVDVLQKELGELGDLVKSALNLGGEEGREKPMDVDGDGNDGNIPPSSSIPIPPLPPYPSSTAENTTPRTQHHTTTTSSSNFAPTPTPGPFTSDMGTPMAPNTAGTSTFHFQSFQPPIRNHTTPAAAAAAAAAAGGGVAAKTTFTAPPPTSTLRGTPTATATATAAPPAVNRSFRMGTPMAPNTAGTSTFQSQPPIRNHTTPAAAAGGGGGGGGGVAAKITFTAPPPTSTLRGTATATAAPPAANRSFSMGTWERKPKNKPRGILTPQQMKQKQSERNSARKLLRKGMKKGKGPVKSDNPLLRTQKQRKLSDKRMNAPSTGTPLKVSGSTTATPELPFNIQF
eukprot:scaffold4191_cov76-Skeletonema_dohrnii-CCMP3373.AAC.3